MNVSSAASYTSQGKICVRNGNTIHISHTRTSQVQYNNRYVILRNILIEPNITKNILYVSQFLKDNSAYFVLLPNCCIVKDLTTLKVPLEIC